MSKPIQSQNPIESMVHEAMAVPQEMLQEVSSGHKALFIGIPREVSFQENRIALVPDAVA